MSYDLFLVAAPGTDVPDVGGWAATLRRQSSVFDLCEVTEFSSDPDEADIWALEDGIEDEDWSVSEFRTFCHAQDLSGRTDDPVAAAAFVRSRWGTNLAAVAMPRHQADVELAYQHLVAVAARHSVRLHDPQVGEDVDLGSAGRLPGLWR